MIDEVWKPLLNAEYAVSNTGKVASIKLGWKLLKTPSNSKGYPLVCLMANGIRKSFSVHQLVANAFLSPKPSPAHEVNHKDGVKTNNLDTNLEWATPSENIQHSYDVLENKAARGEAHGRAKLTENIVRDIRKRAASGEPNSKISADVGVSRSVVWSISTGKTWRWLNGA